MRLEELDTKSLELAEKLAAAMEEKGDEFFTSPQTVKQALGLTDADIDELENEYRHYCEYKEWGKACECLTYLIFIDATNPTYFFHLGARLMDDKKWEEAITPLGMCLSLEDNDPRPLLSIGCCLLEIGDKEKAKEAFNDCIDVARTSNIPDSEEVINLATNALNML